MGDYLNVDQLRLAIAPDPSQRAGTAASLGDAELQGCISRAQAEVDGRLAVRYSTPFEPVPGLVTALTTEVAIYLANLQYRRNKDLAAFDPVVLRYQWARELLDKIVSGKADLVEIDGTEPAAPTSGHVGAPINPNGGARLFGLSDFGLSVRGGPRDGW